MLTEIDYERLDEALLAVNNCRVKGIKCTLEVPLRFAGSAKIYHMGKDNNTLRIDIRLEDKNDK